MTTDCIVANVSITDCYSSDSPPCLFDNALPCCPVELNPDIAGAGVISAYSVSALLAVIAVIVGYLSDSLPEQFYNEYDRCLILNASGQLRYKFLLPLARYERSKRVKTLQRFILALSDQQLVTGIAVVLGAVIQSSQTTVGEFTVVTSLAWFSTTVHLVTLIALKDHLHQHKTLRNIRLVFMLLMLGLLIFALTLSYSTWFEYQGRVLGCALYALQPSSLLKAILPVMVTLILFGQAMTALLTAPSHRGPIIPILPFLARSILSRSMEPDVRDLLGNGPIRKGLVGFVASNVELARLSRSRLPIIAQILFYHHLESFSFLLGRIIIALLYSLSYVSLYVIVHSDLYTSSGPITISREIGFGQILAILLIILPFLAAHESISELKVKSVPKAADVAQSSEIDSTDDSPFCERVDQEFTEKEINLNRYFPLEILHLNSLNGTQSSQAKQTLLHSLSDIQLKTQMLLRHSKSNTAVLMASFTYQLILVVVVSGISSMYSYLSVDPTTVIACWIISSMLISKILTEWPYVLCYVHLTRWGNQDEKAKLMKYLDMLAKDLSKQQAENASCTSTATVSSSTQTPALNIPRRSWTT